MMLAIVKHLTIFRDRRSIFLIGYCIFFPAASPLIRLCIGEVKWLKLFPSLGSV